MHKDFIVEESETIDYVIKKILFNSKRTVLVKSKNNKIIGTISEGDVLRSILQKKNLNSPASKIMNKSFKYLIGKIEKEKAKKIFITNNVNILPILTRDFRLIKLITLKDLF